MSKIITLAVTHLVPVTEIMTVRVPDEFDLGVEVDKSKEAVGELETYEQLKGDAVVVSEVVGEKKDFEFTQTAVQSVTEVPKEDFDKGSVPVREH